jgi:uncharacterized membrane protein YgcG
MQPTEQKPRLVQALGSARSKVCEENPETIDGSIIGLALSADGATLIEVEHNLRISVGPDGCVSLGISAEATGRTVQNCCGSISSLPSESCSSGLGGLEHAALCHGLPRMGVFGGGARPRSRTGTYFTIPTIQAYVGGAPVTELHDGDVVEIRADFQLRGDYGAPDLSSVATGFPAGTIYGDSTVAVAVIEQSSDIQNRIACWEAGVSYHLRKTYKITFLGVDCPARSVVWCAIVLDSIPAVGHLVFNSAGEYTCPAEVTNAVGPDAPCSTSDSSGGGGPSVSSGGGGVSGGVSSLGGGLGGGPGP